LRPSPKGRQKKGSCSPQKYINPRIFRAKFLLLFLPQLNGGFTEAVSVEKSNAEQLPANKFQSQRLSKFAIFLFKGSK
jgi:hypothetical protein